VLIGVFAICWLPFFIVALLLPLCESCREELPNIVNNIFLWLGYINSCVNPIICKHTISLSKAFNSSFYLSFNYAFGPKNVFGQIRTKNVFGHILTKECVRTYSDQRICLDIFWPKNVFGHILTKECVRAYSDQRMCLDIFAPKNILCPWTWIWMPSS